jgi:magnesium-protoporphyrin O-methyltransferase
MMTSATYDVYRARLETYFDRTAMDAWARLTSDAPVSGIRATVRKGREAMHTTLMGWLPDNMTGLRVLDGGCGTGALAVEAAKRGARVVAIDVSASLVDIARTRAFEAAPVGLDIDWQVGDMLDPRLGAFDHVIAMDSLIHYQTTDIIAAVDTLRARTSGSVVFTFAPRTPLLTVMHTAGLMFPRGDRAPAIVPVTENTLRQHFGSAARRGQRISSGFYKSHALEVLPR